MNDQARLAFAGTPEFAVPSLRAVIDSGYPLAGVWTQPDRPAGRGRRPRPSPVKACALEHGLPVHQPESLRTADARRALADAAPDLLVVVAYGLLLPRAVLDLPGRGCVNVHASLLPRWRGAAPIQRAILAGDSETGVCLMAMEPGLDTGPVYACRRTAIDPEDTAGTVHDRLAELGGSLLAGQLAELLAGRAVATPQDHGRATYAAKLDKAEARLDWRDDARSLARRVAAFNPWPVAETEWQGARLRLWRARPLGDRPAAAEPGQVVATAPDGVDVATGDGVLRVTELQAPGGRPQPAASFLNGHRLEPGERLG